MLYVGTSCHIGCRSTGSEPPSLCPCHCERMGKGQRCVAGMTVIWGPCIGPDQKLWWQLVAACGSMWGYRGAFPGGYDAACRYLHWAALTFPALGLHWAVQPQHSETGIRSNPQHSPAIPAASVAPLWTGCPPPRGFWGGSMLPAGQPTRKAAITASSGLRKGSDCLGFSHNW